MKRIEHPITLKGRLVRLEPLQESHFNELIAAAKDPLIWAMLPVDGTDPVKLQIELRNALLHRRTGTQYPFTVIDNASGLAIGSTRLIEIFPEHNKLEIGWTWYARDYWGKGHNLECKLLLLRYCFEVLAVNRVQFKTRDTNVRSRAAIEKIGARFEGVLRKDRVTSDGQVRDTYVFSIINDEWKQAETALLALIGNE
jgi:RimJ/RimL family protein N-acetyltransferase